MRGELLTAACRGVCRQGNVDDGAELHRRRGPAGIHEYRLTQFNRWGLESDAAVLQTSVGNPPAPPRSLTAAAAGCGAVTLSWQAPADGTVVSYRIYRSEAAGGTYQFLAGVGASTTSYTDRPLTPGQTYRYTVSAILDAGGSLVESAPSAEASVAVTCADPPAPVITTPAVAGQALHGRG